ncbi:MAG: hypothetical protein ABFE07_03645 [Armatimonadia bacterium]
MAHRGRVGAVFVPRGDLVDALGDDLLHLVADLLGLAILLQAGGLPPGELQC